MNIILHSDHRLRDRITAFESYMFITERRFTAQHDAFPSNTFPVFDGSTRKDFHLDGLPERRSAQTYFDSCMRRRTGHLPKGTDVGCFLLYLEAESPEENDEEYFHDVFCQFSEVVAKFCKDTDMVAVMVPHFHQGENMAHIHFLYQRRPDEHDVFQDYITQELSE